MNSNLQQAPKEENEPGVVSRPGQILPVIVGIWVVLIGCAFTALLAYHNLPGERGKQSLVWPANNAIKLDTQRANLLVFIHPKCPCSVSTLNELARIQSICGNRVHTQVVFYCPPEMNWEDTSKVRQALAIPQVHITNDATGQLTRRFGAITSGHTLLYSSEGRRVFSGGITPARGHEGDNLGRDSIVEFILNGKVICDEANVFGCPILDASSQVAINSRGAKHGTE